MSVYIVFTREKMKDKAEMDLYSKLVRPTFKDHPVKILAAYGPHQVLEGALTEGMVIVEFPSKEAAMAWYDGPEYREVRKHRFAGADYRAILVQGVEGAG